MRDFSVTPHGVCAKAIRFRIDDLGRLSDIDFEGGCAGCQTGIARLAEGMDASQVSLLLHGIRCKGKGTSCPDQLAMAIAKAIGGSDV